MIKKSLFADEIADSMQKQLQPFEKTASSNNLVKVADYLQASMEIFDDLGMTQKSDQILSVLESIGKSAQKDPRKISDPHTKGLTPDKMVKNLLHHGTEFNLSDDGVANDLLNLDINDSDLELLEGAELSDMDFEDEI